MDPYIGIKQDRDDDELEEDKIRTIGVFVNDSESFIKKYIKHFQKVGRNHIKERFQDFGITCAAGSQWTKSRVKKLGSPGRAKLVKSKLSVYFRLVRKS